MSEYPGHRLAILDGREEDLRYNYPLSLMPVISKVCSVRIILDR